MKNLCFILFLLSAKLFAQNWQPFPLHQITTWVINDYDVDYFFADSTYVNSNEENVVLLNYQFYDENLYFCKDAIIQQVDSLIENNIVYEPEFEMILNLNWDLLPDTIITNENQVEFKEGENSITFDVLQMLQSVQFAGMLNNDSLFLHCMGVTYMDFLNLTDSVKYFYPVFNDTVIEALNGLPLFSISKKYGLVQFVNPYDLFNGAVNNYEIKGFQKLGEIQHGFIGSAYDFSFQPECDGDKISYSSHGFYNQDIYYTDIYADSIGNLIRTDTSLSYTFFPYYSNINGPFGNSNYYSTIRDKHFSLFSSLFNPIKNYMPRLVPEIYVDKYVFSTFILYLNSNGTVIREFYTFPELTTTCNLILNVNYVGEINCDCYKGTYKEKIGLVDFPFYMNWFMEAGFQTSFDGYKKCDYQEGTVLNGNYIIYSNTTPIQNTGISVYPNPVNKSLSIEFEPKSKNSSIAIVNMQGKVVLNQSFQSEISLSNVEPGMYLLFINDGETTYTTKFLKLNQ